MATMEQFSEVAIATQNHQKRNPTSSIAEVNYLLNKMDEIGNVTENIKGGPLITEPVILGDNETGMNFFGGQRVNTGGSRVLQEGKMGWVEKAMAVQVTQRELDLNNGEEALFSLVETRLDAGRDTQANGMAVEIYGDGSIDQSMSGLPSFIQASGGGVYAGLDTALYPRWRNQAMQLAPGYTAVDLEDAIVRLAINCTDGSDAPNLLVPSVKHWTMLEREMRGKIRYNDPAYMKKSKAANGLSVISAANMEAMLDHNSAFGMDLDMTYVLNTKYFYLYNHPDADWSFDKGQKPYDSFQKVMLARWMGNMFCKKRRSQGILYV